jgi:hypothetical protein
VFTRLEDRPPGWSCQADPKVRTASGRDALGVRIDVEVTPDDRRRDRRSAQCTRVFLIQRAQNKDSLAIHLKLNEIVAAMGGASNRLVDVESLSEKELAQLHRFYRELSSLCQREGDVAISHSVEEARQRHAAKHGPRKASA